jgi:diaminopimelate epimerase
MPTWSAQFRIAPISAGRGRDTNAVPIELGPLAKPVATSMAIRMRLFFVPDAETIELDKLGPQLEHQHVPAARQYRYRAIP